MPIPRASKPCSTIWRRRNPKAAAADPKTFVDPSFVQEMESSGFIKQLYKTLALSLAGARSPPKAGSLQSLKFDGGSIQPWVSPVLSFKRRIRSHLDGSVGS